jgi:hypothetical protein
MFLFQEVRNYIINQKERGLLHKHTHTDHLQQQQQDLGNIIIIPLSNKIGKKRKNTLPYKNYGPEGSVHNPPCSLLLFCCVGEASFTCKNGIQMGWVQNGSSRKEDGKRTGIEYYYNMKQRKKHENGQETLKQTMHTKLIS